MNDDTEDMSSNSCKTICTRFLINPIQTLEHFKLLKVCNLIMCALTLHFFCKLNCKVEELFIDVVGQDTYNIIAIYQRRK